MTTPGRKLLSSLIYSGDMHAYMRLGLAAHLFKESEAVLFDFVTNHVASFGAIPAQETIEGTPGLEDSLTKAVEPPEYYLAEVEKRYLHNTLKAMVTEATSFLTEKNGEAAMEALVNAVGEIYEKKNRKHLFDFRDAQQIVLDAYQAQNADEDSQGLLFGWPTLDNMTGGLHGGDFCAIVGRPAAGKTFMLLYNAMHSWRKSKQVPLFVSMEMNKLIICQRLSAMYSHKNLTTLLKAKMSTSMFNSMMIDLGELESMPNPFWVVDGNMATMVDDLVMMCRQLKPSSVLVDGAYLLRHKDQKLGKWDRMSVNAELLKQRIATDLDLPVVASYQFSREATKKGKKNKDEKPGIEDIYGSDSMGQLASVALGLFEEESIETMVRRRVEILKGRNGEVGKFTINWGFNTMNFDEYVEQNPGELQFAE